MIDVLICNHDTEYYTNNCIRTFIHENKDLNYRIYILDDSNKEKFSLHKDYSHNNIVIMDNTERKLFSYSEIIKQYVKFPRFNNACYYHAINIQWFIDNISTQYFILLDSDIIFKKRIDFLNYITNNIYITCGFLEDNVTVKYKDSNVIRLPRIYPYLQLFNAKIIKDNNIRYFDPSRLIQDTEFHLKYDTGASFYEDITKNNIPFKIINKSIYDYIHHYKAKSWNN